MSYSQAHTTNSMLSNLTPTQIRLYEKQQEHASLQALKEASGQMLERVEELARMSHVMADGGAAVGSVLRNWNQVFSILNLFDKPPTDSQQPSDPNNPNQKTSSTTAQSKSRSGQHPSGDVEINPSDADRDDREEMEEELPMLVRLQFDKYPTQTQGQASDRNQVDEEGGVEGI